MAQVHIAIEIKCISRWIDSQAFFLRFEVLRLRFPFLVPFTFRWTQFHTYQSESFSVLCSTLAARNIYYVPRNKQLSLNCSESWKIYVQMIRVDKGNNGCFHQKEPQSLKTNWCFNYHLGVAWPLHWNDFSFLETDLSFFMSFWAFLKLRWTNSRLLMNKINVFLFFRVLLFYNRRIFPC